MTINATADITGMSGTRNGTWRDDNLLPFVRRTIVALAIVAFASLIVILRDLVLALFAAILVGVLLQTAAEFIGRRAHLGHRVSLAITCAVSFLILAGAAAFIWPFVQQQIPNLFDRVTSALNQIEQNFGVTLPENVQDIANNIGGLSEQLWTFVMAVVGALVTAVSGIILVIAAGIFLAARPEMYREGLVLLFPTVWHNGVRKIIGQVGRGLVLWVRAQFVAMLVVGVSTGLGAWAIGLPSPMALGLFAGLGEFIPIIGPFLAMLPALLVAFVEGGDLIIWTIALYLLVQQLEGNVLTPWLQERIAAVPSVVLLFSMVAFGMMFGIIGVILAAPLTVAANIIVREIYIRDILNEDALLKTPPSDPVN